MGMSMQQFSGVAYGVSFLGENIVVFAERLGVHILKLHPLAFNSLNDFVNSFVNNPSDNIFVKKMFPDVNFISWYDEASDKTALVVFVKDSSVGVYGPFDSMLPLMLNPVERFWLEPILSATGFSSLETGWIYFASTA